MVDSADGQVKDAVDAVKVDRSDTLFQVGLALAGSNVPIPAIINTLSERDRTLGYNKYWQRRDGGQAEYDRIARKAFDAIEDGYVVGGQGWNPTKSTTTAEAGSGSQDGAAEGVKETSLAVYELGGPDLPSGPTGGIRT